jgi:hypothetical protein
MSEDEITVELLLDPELDDTDPETEPEPEPEPEAPYEVPLVCGHWVCTYEEAGKDYCGICGTYIGEAA